MKTANEMRRIKVWDQEWIDEKWAEIEKNTTGRHVILIGTHVTTKGTSDELVRQLIRNGFMTSYQRNVHDVKMLIVEW